MITSFRNSKYKSIHFFKDFNSSSFPGNLAKTLSSSSKKIQDYWSHALFHYLFVTLLYFWHVYHFNLYVFFLFSFTFFFFFFFSIFFNFNFFSWCSVLTMPSVRRDIKLKIEQLWYFFFFFLYSYSFPFYFSLYKAFI